MISPGQFAATEERLAGPPSTRALRPQPSTAAEDWDAVKALVILAGDGGCFVHFADIETPGYRVLHEGEHVRFTFERLPFLQDGCPYRALAVWPQE